MAKYEGWTRGETEALLNKVGGAEVARAVLRGEKKLIIEDVVRTPVKSPESAPLVGTLAKTIVLKPYNAQSVAEAIKLGKYDYVDGGVAELFATDGASLDKETRIELYQFDRDPESQEVMDWAKANGNKKPIGTAYIYAVGIQHPEIQRQNPVVELGSVRGGLVLCLNGGSDWRDLRRFAFRYGWDRRCLFGFFSE